MIGKTAMKKPFRKKSPGTMSPMTVGLVMFCFSYLIMFPSCYAAGEIRLGVLAKRGYQTAMKRWDPLAQYLSKKVGADVKVVPLNFVQLPEYVSQNKVDLVIANQKFYVSLKKKYGIRAIATLITASGGPYMGGVIFSGRKGRIRNIKQIRGKKVGVVSLGSAGGFLIEAYDLLQKGINILKEAEIKPLEGQDYVVYAVLNGAVDVGFVRTGQLESMSKEKKINLNDFYIISRENHPNFPLLCSTAQLWPAWPISVTGRIQSGLASRIKNVLLGLPAGSRAARAAGIRGFAPPGDYSQVAEALAAIGNN